MHLIFTAPHLCSCSEVPSHQRYGNPSVNSKLSLFRADFSFSISCFLPQAATYKLIAEVREAVVIYHPEWYQPQERQFIAGGMLSSKIETVQRLWQKLRHFLHFVCRTINSPPWIYFHEGHAARKKNYNGGIHFLFRSVLGSQAIRAILRCHVLSIAAQFFYLNKILIAESELKLSTERFI